MELLPLLEETPELSISFCQLKTQWEGDHLHIRRRALTRKSDQPALWFGTSWPPELWEVSVYCLSHLANAYCKQQTEQTNTQDLFSEFITLAFFFFTYLSTWRIPRDFVWKKGAWKRGKKRTNGQGAALRDNLKKLKDRRFLLGSNEAVLNGFDPWAGPAGHETRTGKQNQ